MGVNNISNYGMSEKTYNHIVENSSALKEIDLKNGIVTTVRDSNGAICTSTGYLRVKLNGKAIQVHQILAVKYFGKKCIGLQVNHIDGNKLNNKRDNLEIISRRENIRHQMENGLFYNNGFDKRKLTSEQVREIRKNHVRGKSNVKYNTAYYAEKFSMSKSNINKMIKGETYRDVL